MVFMDSPEFIERFVIYNKIKSIKFDVYDTNGEKKPDISTFPTIYRFLTIVVQTFVDWNLSVYFGYSYAVSKLLYDLS